MDNIYYFLLFILGMLCVFKISRQLTIIRENGEKYLELSIRDPWLFSIQKLWNKWIGKNKVTEVENDKRRFPVQITEVRHDKEKIKKAAHYLKDYPDMLNAYRNLGKKIKSGWPELSSPQTDHLTKENLCL